MVWDYWADTSEHVGYSAVDRLMEALRWCPASEQKLRETEDRLLSFVRAPHELVQVNIGPPPHPRGASFHQQTCTTSSRSPGSSSSSGGGGSAGSSNIGRSSSMNGSHHAGNSSSSFTASNGRMMNGDASSSSLSPSASSASSFPAKLGNASFSWLSIWGFEEIAGRWGAEEDDDRGWRGADEVDCYINTLVVGDAAVGKEDLEGKEKPNLVMVHGYAACLGFFFRTFATLSRHFNVYAIDQLGWGASSRPEFTPSNTDEAEEWFVQALEMWRRKMRLKRFVLLGHSLGGYVSARYALRYPQHIQHLVLVGPAGFNHESLKMQRFRRTWKGFAFQCIWETNMTPQTLIRLLGPVSADLVKSATMERWSNLPNGQEDMMEDEVDAFTDYIFQTLSAPMSGELCMKHIFSLGAFARKPLIDNAYAWKVPTSFIYGQDDIFDHRAGLGAAKLMPVPVEVMNLSDVGHMMFLEKPTLFTQAVLHACRDVLPATSRAVADATAAVHEHMVPLDRSHRISFDGSHDLFASQGSGKSGVRRLANGWGIG